MNEGLVVVKLWKMRMKRMKISIQEQAFRSSYIPLDTDLGIGRVTFPMSLPLSPATYTRYNKPLRFQSGRTPRHGAEQAYSRLGASLSIASMRNMWKIIMMSIL